MTDLSETSDLVKLDHQLCFLLYAGSRAIIKAYQPMLAEMDITYPQYLALMVLWEWHDDTSIEPTVKALGQRLQLDSGTLTPLLKRLEKQGLVTRVRDAADERKVLLKATDSGLALRHIAMRWLDKQQQQLQLEDGEITDLRNRLRQLLRLVQG